MRTTLALALALVLFAVVPHCLVADAATPRPLRVGLIPEINVFKQKARYRPLAELLGKRLGREVQLTILPAYGDALALLAAEELDGAFLGSAAATAAIDELGAIPLARPQRADGVSTYRGLILVLTSSPLRTIEDLRGRRIALVAPETTAGHLLPFALARQASAGDPRRFFGEIFYAGSHDAAIATLLARRAEVAAAKDTVFDSAVADDPEILAQVRIIARSAAVPANTLVVSRALDQPTRERVAQILLALERDEAGRAALAVLDAERFIATSSADFEPVRELARAAGVPLTVKRTSAP